MHNALGFISNLQRKGKKRHTVQKLTFFKSRISEIVDFRAREITSKKQETLHNDKRINAPKHDNPVCICM
jgi:hypothetical protein